MNQKAAPNSPISRARSLALVAISYLTALGAGGATLALAPIADTLLLTFVADVVATLVIFGWSLTYDNSSFYDAYWSVIPIAIVLYWIGVAAKLDARTSLVFIVVFVWGLRLTFNWARGWTGLEHEDWRYVNFREQFPRLYWAISFGGIHFFPTLIVFAGLGAAWPAFASNTRPLGWIDALALAFGIIGISLEWVADRQLRDFVLNRGRIAGDSGNQQGGAILRTGLWRYSRHPNYLGEMLLWWSLYLFGLAASERGSAWAIAAPVAMTAMFLGVSIPLLEKRSLARRPGYQQVIDETSMLIPMPPRRIRL